MSLGNAVEYAEGMVVIMAEKEGGVEISYIFCDNGIKFIYVITKLVDILYILEECYK